MKIIVDRPATVEIARVGIEVPVNYGTEDISNDFPGRTGNLLRFDVDADSGQILGWPKGRAEWLHMKVCDGGEYMLFNDAGEEITSRNYYVPRAIPGGGDDYLEFNIDGNGMIEGWHQSFTEENISEFWFEDED